MRFAEARLQRSTASASRAGIGLAQRMLDVTFAAAGLVALAPLMLLIAIAVRAETQGPVFFSQVRLGEHERHFRLHKFRKFYHVASASGAAVTLRDDDRMTRVGRLLARSKLDELPQLWNVLTGDMSMVGPRPESLAFAPCFAGRFRAVLELRPGIFGPNQVRFRDEWAFYPAGVDPERFYCEALFPVKAQADLAYFRHRTIIGDLAWIVRGVLAVIGCRFPRDRGPDPATVIEAWIRQGQRV